MPVTDTLARHSSYVETEGEEIYVEVTGLGPPVVLCHGLGGNHAIWWRQVEDFARAHRLVTWDQRGFGLSTLTTRRHGPGRSRADLEAVLSSLDLGPVHLVGQSMGGWVALGFALRHPDKVASLVISTSLAGSPPGAADELAAGEMGRSRLNRREHPVLSATFAAANPDLAVLYNQISGFGRDKPEPQAVLDLLAADRFDAADLGRLRLPVMFLAASDDSFCPPSAMRATAELVPGAVYSRLQGGHSAYYENPQPWNAAVIEFIDSHTT
jgi:3-oxoadipate enol-lactonase